MTETSHCTGAKPLGQSREADAKHHLYAVGDLGFEPRTVAV